MAGTNDIARATGLNTAEVLRVFKSIITMTTNGQKVTIQGIGTFQVKHKAACVKRNPKTGDPVNVAAKDVFHFKPSTTLVL